jgi:hypothetical protein
VLGACDAAAIGNAKASSAIASDARRLIDTGRRFTCGFNMARTLLSSVDGRAMDGAGSQVRPCTLNVRARSSKCEA